MAQNIPAHPQWESTDFQQNQPYPSYREPLARSGMAVAGLVLGIIALATSFLPIVNNLSFILALVGLVLAIVGTVATVRGKKRGKGMAVVSVVLNALALVIVLATQSMYGAAIDEAMVSSDEVAVEAPAASAETGSVEGASDEEKYVIEGVEMTTDGFSTTISGTLTNTTDKEVGYIQLSYTLYDADGAQVGTAFANTNNLDAGGVWKFEAIGLEENVADYKLADVTGF